MWTAAAHVLVGVVALVALLVEATPIGGVHPALKPMKFGFSIAIFLGTMAIVTPLLSVDAGLRRGIEWTLAITTIVETVPIVGQALRGTASHYNTQGAFNAAVWQVMAVAIVVTTLAMVLVAIVATVRPLVGSTELHSTHSRRRRGARDYGCSSWRRSRGSTRSSRTSDAYDRRSPGSVVKS